jgi:hypothetical protein
VLLFRFLISPPLPLTIAEGGWASRLSGERSLASHRYIRYSALERWAIRNNDAPAKKCFKAWKGSQPAPNPSLDQVRAEFVRWQDELGRRLHDAEGFDLQRATQPFPIWPLKVSLASSSR